MALPIQTLSPQRLYTAEEFRVLSLDSHKRYELVRGMVKEMFWPGGQHALICSNLHLALSLFMGTKDLGRALPPGFFKLEIPGEPHDSLRLPDITFLTEDKITWQTGAFEVIPDLVVEVYSETDRPDEMHEKLADYALAGWNLVWIVYPPESLPHYKVGTVEIYHLQESLEPVRTLQANETLAGEGILAGFVIPVQQLFE